MQKIIRSLEEILFPVKKNCWQCKKKIRGRAIKLLSQHLKHAICLFCFRQAIKKVFTGGSAFSRQLNEKFKNILRFKAINSVHFILFGISLAKLFNVFCFFQEMRSPKEILGFSKATKLIRNKLKQNKIDKKKNFPYLFPFCWSWIPFLKLIRDQFRIKIK